MVAVLIGLIFLGQQLTQVGVMNINGAIFLFLTNMTFQNVFATINVSPTDLADTQSLTGFSHLAGLHLGAARVHAGGA